ncbi:MAG: hypothetical protein KF729_31035 [Sandaracinaceae bacterium]|nr:hypothetical protein [Sandaracinaceae bacterium]
MNLRRCPCCPAFLPSGAPSCALCARAIPRWLRRAAVLVGGAGAAVTLSACYGAPCAGGGGACYETFPEPATECADRSAAGGDGACDEP